MAVNKVVYGSETIIDLSQDTVTPQTLVIGETAHDKAGNIITGTLEELDTSDATATANDIASGQTAYVNGNKVTGIMSELLNGYGFTGTPSVKSGNFYIDSPDLKSRKWIELGNHFYLATDATNLGDATADCVEKGKAFTSVAGLNVAGTLETYGPGHTYAGRVITGIEPAWRSGRVYLEHPFAKKEAFDIDATIEMQIMGDRLGDATASDVAKGKTFTSTAGLKVVGTAEETVSDNNCEAYLIDATNPVVNFKSTGTIKIYGYAQGVKSGYTTPKYAFVGTEYITISSWGSDTSTALNLTIDSSTGEISGLPSMASGTLLITRGV